MHEIKDDVNVRAVTKFGLGLAGGIVSAAFLMWFLFDQFAARETRQSPQPERMETTCDFTLDGGPTYSTFGVATYNGWTESDKGQRLAPGTATVAFPQKG